MELSFAQGESRVCHRVEINNDDECEVDPRESFLSNLRFISGVPPVVIDPPATEVFIDDTNEPECGELESVATIVCT